VTDYRTVPIDETSRARLAERGLRLALLDPVDEPAYNRWLEVVNRGFHGGAQTEEELGWMRGLTYRRTTGVWDDSAADPDVPVASANSWPAQLTVPGSALAAWAISMVTVSPTHRRRGIARGMLEAELRTAAGLGIPVAMLTVSESPLYGRYGFAPAAFASDLTVDTRRAAWTGPAPDGRVDFITPAEWREEIAGLHNRVRLASPGEIEVFPLRWDQFSGSKSSDRDKAKRTRAVQYTDEAGQVRGLALFHVGGGDDDFTKHHATVDYLCTETPDAYAALWRFLLELDLVAEVRAHLRPVDEPLRWMVADQRSIVQTVTDHQYLRILDLPSALAARRYERDGHLELTIADDLGFTAGRWTVDVAGGHATVAAGGSGTTHITVQQLSASYLGAVPRITPELALLATAAAPWLSVWY
jgi:predicted acetyltransferase